ncbi:DUF1156 domain-containing protein [Leptospira biflexa]|uniref:anti-phage-associated DUF1156 domain-containing protein n=1 Tax=Leptospira biflexa TaxID=172 RepID=UPI001091134E|nr:anti-phage-associated DUF1156 domain-containing protein [Leptospira biflexa]TGM42337.1 DUF1156 domain-containing protein [Leptospira biflexa]TGM44223.1 DUF1156 domain-containing protein [Leptospira biflexa]
MTQTRSFIETQFPVSKISKESYKERMANYSQTLTGLGKWWGRKPLVLVRATVLGLLLPSTDNPEKDREIFLRLLTMDEEGLRLRKQASGKKLSASEILQILTDESHEARVLKKIEGFESLPHVLHDLRSSIRQYMSIDGDKAKWHKTVEPKTKEELEKLAFQALYYDEKLDYCVRPEHIENLTPESWAVVNEHLGTKATSLPELVEELGIRLFGHRPKVGDAFCGGGSIPFEAARIGCDVYASDLNPVAALLTWAGLHIIGGGPEVAKEVKDAQETIYQAVNKQVTEWGIEHNEWGHRADAYLYCVEVVDPETGWKVPLAPSWVIGEKTKTVAILEPILSEKRYRIRIQMNATDAQMKTAKQGTVQKGYVTHPENPNPVPMSLIRRENAGGLRLWENEDVVPRPEDVFQERLYCIRYVNQKWSEKWKDLQILAQSFPNKLLSLWQIDGEWAHTFQEKTLRDLALQISGTHLTEVTKALSAHTEDAIRILYTALRNPDKVQSKDKTLTLRSQFTLFQITSTLEIHKAHVELVSFALDKPEATMFAAEKTPKKPKKGSESQPSLLDSDEPLYLDPPDSEFRYYTEPSDSDLEREERALSLLRERFANWQELGYIPSRKIEPGAKTDEPIRTRGWTHWHHLFNPRQLLVNGELLKQNFSTRELASIMLSIGKCLDYNAKLTRWTVAAGSEKTDNVFSNQALNTLANYGTRSLYSSEDNFKFSYNFSSFIRNTILIKTRNVNDILESNDIWITDPPYADAVNYHELTEFFLAWYEKHLPKLFPDWYTDSKRALAIKGDGEDFRRSMVEAYRNLAKHMPENGMQVVMFTHQDAGVWADLALILWASGLRVTGAWTIATETTSALKEGNYVQGTVLMVLRKNNSERTAFLDELVPEIKEEVKLQIESMSRIEDKEEPNFGDTDYQLAAYAASLRVLTSYSSLGDIQIERELSRTRSKNDPKSPLEEVIENAKEVATSYLIPEGIIKEQWNGLGLEERFYLKALDLESKGENKAGIFQELARSYGFREYEQVMESLTANASRPKSALEFKTNLLGGDSTFGSSTLRLVLYAVFVAVDTGDPGVGKFTLQRELSGYWNKRLQVLWILRYLTRFGTRMSHYQVLSEKAQILAGLVENDRQ